MTNTIPNLSEVVSNLHEDFRNQLPNSSAVIWPNNIDISAKAFGGAVWELYGYICRGLDARMPDTATGQDLDRLARIKGLTRKPASKSRGLIEFTGVDGTIIASGEIFQTLDGVQFSVTEAEEVSGGVVVLEVESVEYGKDNNVAGGTDIIVAGTIADLNASGVVGMAGIGGGADIEDDDELRVRLNQAYSSVGVAGTISYYESLALQNEGVTNAWVEGSSTGALPNCNDVYVYFTMDTTYADGIPLLADGLIVKDHLNNNAEATDNISVFIPTPIAIDIEIANLVPNSPEVQAAVISELEDMIIRKREVGLPSTPFEFSVSWVSALLFSFLGAFLACSCSLARNSLKTPNLPRNIIS